MKLKRLSLILSSVFIILSIIILPVNIWAYDGETIITMDQNGGIFGDITRTVNSISSECRTYDVSTTLNPTGESSSVIQGMDFLFLVDTSGSMSMLDAGYKDDGSEKNRSEAVREGIMEFINSKVESNRDKTKSDIRVALASYDNIFYGAYLAGTTMPSNSDGYFYNKDYLRSVSETQNPSGSTDLGVGLDGSLVMVSKLNDNVNYGDPVTPGREKNRTKAVIIFTDGNIRAGMGHHASDLRNELARGDVNNYSNIFIVNSVTEMEDIEEATRDIIKTSSTGGIDNTIIPASSIGSRGSVMGPAGDFTSDACLSRNYIKVTKNFTDPYIKSSVESQNSSVGYSNLKDAFMAIQESAANKNLISEPITIVDNIDNNFEFVSSSANAMLKKENGTQVQIPVQESISGQTISIILQLDDPSLTEVDTIKDTIEVMYNVKAKDSAKAGKLNIFDNTFLNFMSPISNPNSPVDVEEPLQLQLSTDMYEVDNYGEITLSDAFGLNQQADGTISGVTGGMYPYRVNWMYLNKTSNIYEIIPNGIDAVYDLKEDTDFSVEITSSSGCVVKGMSKVVKTGTALEVNYLEKETNNDLTTPTITQMKIGDNYEAKELEIPGYTLTDPKPTNEKGIISDPVTVTYYYKKIPNETGIILKYVNESGEEISDPTIGEGKVGDEYKTKAKDIEGYTLIETPENATGIMTEETITVIYIYSKNLEPLPLGVINVLYIDNNTGGTLDQQSLSGSVGDTYETKKEEFNGYTFESVEGETKGVYTEETIEVVYKYDKNILPATGGLMDAKIVIIMGSIFILLGIGMRKVKDIK